LADIAAGRCTITEEEVDQAAQTDPVLAEILTGLLFLHEDIVLRTAQRDQALADAEAANRELEAFMHRVSHDLKSPITSLLLATDNILRRHGSALDPKAQDSLAGIRKTANRMNQIIDDLLKLSQVTLVSIARRTVDLTAMAHEVALGLKETQPERRVTVDIQPGVTAVTDSNLTRNLLENLLGNAWKYTGKREDPRIEFGMGSAGGENVYFVRDNGVGFDMAQAQDLFVPFRRLTTAGEFPGSGVGLSIVHRIVERHGGRVWAEATPGGGATFYFTLEGKGESQPG
jgi:light-regulated signal transduction histidine kinase (bacteriophytochrome)